jgi:hypothetical protein
MATLVERQTIALEKIAKSLAVIAAKLDVLASTVKPDSEAQPAVTTIEVT